MTYIFDLDGTLTDTNGLWAEVDAEFLRRRGLAPTPEYAREIMRCTFVSAAALTKRLYNLPDTPEELMAEWENMAARHYTDLAPLKEGAGAFVRQCAAKGHTLAVFTACRPTLCRAALARLGLLDLFVHLVFAEELSYEKWDPRCYTELCTLVGAQPAECVFFDDSPDNCAAAAKAGLSVVGVYDAHFAARQDEMRNVCGRYVHSLQELVR